MPSVRGHKLKVGKPKAGKVSGKCSCGGWVGTAANAEDLERLWNQRHINKFDTLR